MPAGDVYQLTDIQLFNDSVECRNVYYFRQEGGTAGSPVLSGAFVGTMLPGIVICQTVQVTHERIEVINLDNPADYYTQTLTAANVGTFGGSSLPPFVTYAVRLSRASRACRHGWKRYVGVSENGQAQGIVNDATLEGYLATMALYQTALLGDAVDQWRQRIFRAAKPDATPPIERDDFPIASGNYIRIGTCNSRKYT